MYIFWYYDAVKTASRRRYYWHYDVVKTASRRIFNGLTTSFLPPYDIAKVIILFK